MCLRYDLTYTTIKELSQVLQQPTIKTADEILKRALRYAAQTKHAYLFFSHDAMQFYMPPKTRRKPTDTDNSCYETQEYNVEDGIKQPDHQQVQDYTYTGTGEHVTQTCMPDIDLAEQIETRQSTSGTMNYLNGVLVHWRGRTERLIVHTTAAGEYIALSRGNATAKYMRDIMIFYSNTQNIYHLYTDNQAAEHIATQPNMNDHSRSIDIRIHGIRQQDYLDNAMRIGGVASEDNTTDILTKNLHPTSPTPKTLYPPTPTRPQTNTQKEGNNIYQQCTQTRLTLRSSEKRASEGSQYVASPKETPWPAHACTHTQTFADSYAANVGKES
jgi:hypothetical protein